MTAIYYDCEFVEDGTTIDLISIGMVAEKNELYCIAADDQLIDRAANRPWLAKNVLPHLPLKIVYDRGLVMYDGPEQYSPVKYWEWDEAHPDFANVLPRKAIRAQVRSFILEHKDPQLWAYFGAYDHVALCQLFGKMIDLPNGIPMYTNEYMQEWRRRNMPQKPKQPTDQHNALADARWLALAHYMLTAVDE